MYNHLLDTFLVVARTGSFTKAAQELYLSPTAVMKQMNQLEQQLELPLLERTNQGIALTDCGRSLYADARQIMDLSSRALARAKRLVQQDTHVIRVGTSLLNPCRVFMDIWFMHSHHIPNCRVEIIPFEDDHRGISSVIDRIGQSFDFWVGVFDSTDWARRCSFMPLGQYRKCIAVPMDHPLARKTRLTLSDLHGYTLMMIPEGDSPVNDAIREELKRNHPQVTILDTPKNYDLSVFNRALELNNLLLNIECWSEIHPSLVTLPVEWDYTIPYGLLYAREPGVSAKAFLSLLEK